MIGKETRMEYKGEGLFIDCGNVEPTLERLMI